MGCSAAWPHRPRRGRRRAREGRGPWCEVTARDIAKLVSAPSMI
jgi:hypothetical protein